MIIKSLSRKDTNYQQIFQYLFRDADGMPASLSYIHNLDIDDPSDQEGMIKAFRENDAYRSKRKNGISFYHEILSFAPEDTLAIIARPEILRDIIAQYLQRRAPHALAVAKVHMDKKHLHVHCIISANEREYATSTRISKAQFESIKQEIQAYQRECYPELKHGYQKGQEGERGYSHETWMMERKGRKQEQKNRLKQQLIACTKETRSWAELLQKLEQQEISVYYRRNRIAGIFWQQRKYRFTTLIKEEKEALHKLHYEFDAHEQKAIENQVILSWAKKDKRLTAPEVTDWEHIRKKLEALEKQEQKHQQNRERDKGLDRGLERRLG